MPALSHSMSEPVVKAVRPTATHRLLIVDDHPVFRHGMRQLISQLPEVTLCAEAENATSALEKMRTAKPDIALVDVTMPGTNGIELIKLMLAEHPRLIILMISMHDESLYALRALRAGAKGYVMKQQAMETVVDALRKVIGGGVYVSPQLSERLVFKAIHSDDGDLGSPVDRLSDRELEVLQLFGRGETTR